MSILPVPEKQKNSIIVGRRVKSARVLTGLSRIDFSRKTAISLATITSWETPTSNRKGLSKKGANRLIRAFREMGILCTEQWLLYGQGLPPKPVLSHVQSPVEISWGDEESIIKDIQSFRSNNDRAVVHFVLDDLIHPLFHQGSYVGGYKKENNDINELIGLDCIIQTTENEILLRKILKKNDDQTYLLGQINYKTNQFALESHNIVYAAEIIWYRKKESLNEAGKK